MLTGRYQRSMEGSRKLSEKFVTIPSALQGLVTDATAKPDPLDPGSSIGGYCTMIAGKFTPAGDRTGFNAEASIDEQRIGRIDCTVGPGGVPSCGTGQNELLDPSRIRELGELFEFMDETFYPVPGQSGTFAVQPFFVWYAPRIPHRPLRAPEPIYRYLFGGDQAGLGGLFDLGAACTPGHCPPSVLAMDESKVGTQREYYSSVWWVDDNMREIRKYLSRKSAPHCILRDGTTRYSAKTRDRCGLGTWATDFRQPLERNTVIVSLSDNGWFMPDSKHIFSENGYRTRISIYDPRTVSPIAPWRADDAVPLPSNERPELAHSTDLLPTILGLALDTPGVQECPAGGDGTPCDGRDLRPYLRGAASVPSQPLRRALCGHMTSKPTAATRQRYLVTRPGTVGRCVDSSLSACTSTARCRAGELASGVAARRTPPDRRAPIRRAARPARSACEPLRRRPPMYRRLVLRLRPGNAVGPLHSAHGPLV